eukprot:CAMPEP_0177780192 /NCGR_PEP_ID=MMETSP0491_2-20121128/17057_1 /TAXON_ID=63592 /ORGANISM="Tetraselmis chuii, Strain PLY429" /LENGTH=263 /DNA_ID=CAMNT_0019299917 /DNA_START=103 /DNA_END=890 /DNA_ORIENTATION=-
MLDYFCIFTKGGAILWTFQLAALKGEPIQALIRTCLLEERGAEKSFSYTPRDGAAYSLKWRLYNDLGLVFVAVYQRALSLLYVDDLLDRVVTKFVGEFDPAVHNYSAFNDTFRQLVLEAEKQSSERSKIAKGPRPSAKKPNTQNGAKKAATQKAQESEEDDEDGDEGTGSEEADEGGEQGDTHAAESMADRLKKLKLGRRGGRGAAPKAQKASVEEKKPEEKKPKKKQMRNWNNLYAGAEDEEPQRLDFACDSPKKAPMVEEA